MSSDDLEVDHERFIYEEVHVFGSPGPIHVKVGCRHRNPESVRNLLTGTEVARLCPDCNTQLPVEGKIEW